MRTDRAGAFPRSDLVVAVAVFAAAAAAQLWAAPPPGAPAGTVALVLAGLLVPVAPLAVRRRTPVAAWAGFGGGALVVRGFLDLTPVARGVVGLAGLVVLGTVAAARPAGVSVPVFGAHWLALEAVVPSPTGEEAGFRALTLAVIWCGGAGVRRHRRRRLAAERAAVAAERARVERALREVVAARIEEILDAVAGRRSAAGSSARATLQRVDEAARTALDAMRRLLGLLRTPAPDRSPADGAPARAGAGGGARLRLPTVTDLAVAAVPTAVVVLRAVQRPAGTPVRPLAESLGAGPAPALLALLAVLTAALLARRARPAAALLVVVPAAVAFEGIGGQQTVGGSAVLLAVAAAAARLPPGRAALACAGAMVVLSAAPAAGVPAGPDRATLVVALALLAPAAHALGRRRRRRAGAALAGERARLARELHDVVAHHLSGILVQTGAGRLVAAGPAPGAAAGVPAVLAAVEATAVEARESLRSLLEAVDDRPPRSGGRGPGLADLDALVAGARRAGLSATLTTAGTPRPLDAEVELFAYRLVQEAVTNVVKHAAGARVEVLVDHRPAHLELRVGNGPGRTAPPSEGGHGLVGMRERVGLLGGELTAGPGADGGWSVVARLPVGGAAARRPAGRR